METFILKENIKFKKFNFLNAIKKIIPELNKSKKKGDNGIIGIVGGSLDYTGAPYYSAISSLYTGSDLAHIFCHTEAAIPIKCYSPELIVHPGFNKIENKNLLEKTIRWFKTMDTIIFGPGFGRDEDTNHIFKYFLENSLKIKNMIHILDADSLWHFMNEFENLNIDDENFLILTPNKNEFERLYNKIISYTDHFESYDNIVPESDEIFFYNILEENDIFSKEIELARKLKNKILVKKVF